MALVSFLIVVIILNYDKTLLKLNFKNILIDFLKVLKYISTHFILLVEILVNRY